MSRVCDLPPRKEKKYFSSDASLPVDAIIIHNLQRGPFSAAGNMVGISCQVTCRPPHGRQARPVVCLPSRPHWTMSSQLTPQ